MQHVEDGPGARPRRRPRHRLHPRGLRRRQRTYDLILDIAGNPTLARLRSALTPSATAVIAGGEERRTLDRGPRRRFRALVVSLFIRQPLTMVIAREGAADLEYLDGLLDAGALTPVIDRTYPLDKIPEAMRYFDAARLAGRSPSLSKANKRMRRARHVSFSAVPTLCPPPATSAPRQTFITADDAEPDRRGYRPLVTDRTGPRTEHRQALTQDQISEWMSKPGERPRSSQ